MLSSAALDLWIIPSLQVDKLLETDNRSCAKHINDVKQVFLNLYLPSVFRAQQNLKNNNDAI